MPMQPESRPVRQATVIAAVVMVCLAAGAPALSARAAGLPLQTYADNIARGGPPKDGIPAVDEPRFIDPASASRWLDDSDVVFGVERNGVARAYPRRILVWHEIVNDRLGDEAVAVTYCPLTGTAIGFLRGNTTFGVSGRLVNSNLIMYDRATGSYWPQILGRAITGEHRGERLETFPVNWTTWGAWRKRHPQTTVLSRRTGYARDYGRDPYGGYSPRRGYYERGSALLFPVINRDDRLPGKAVVVTALTPDGPLAVPKRLLTEAGSVRLAINGTAYVVLRDPAVGVDRVYRVPEGTELPDGPLRYDNGPAHNGRPLALERVVAWDAFWFAWAGFYPETVLHE